YSEAEIVRQFGPAVLEGTLIRRIEKNFFDVDAAHWQKSAALSGSQIPLVFTLHRRELPEPVPEGWSLEELEDGQIRVTATHSVAVKFDSYRELAVKSAGQLPTGFDPGALYNSHFHPRALQLAVIGAS